MSVLKRVFTAGLWMAGITYITFVIVLAGQILLVRLLLPEDFGLFALALATTELIFMFGGFGVSMSCIALQEEPDVFDTGMYFSLGLAVIMTIVCLGISILASLFYSKKTVIFILIICLTKVVNIPTSIYSASLEKNFKFKRNALITSIVKILSLFMALLLAFFGFGAWSLLGREVLMGVLLLFAMVTFSTYKFSYQFNLETAKKIWEFVYGIYFMRISETGFHRLPIFVLGNLAGINILGLFERSLYFARLPNTMLAPFTSNISFSLYSNIKHDDFQSSKGLYWSLFSVLRITLPIGILIFFFPETILVTIFGANWTKAAPFVRGLSLYLVFIPLFEILKHVLLARGFSKEIMIAFFQSIVITFLGILISYLTDKWYLISWFVGFGLIISFTYLVWTLYKTGISIRWKEIIKVPIFVGALTCILALYLKYNYFAPWLSIVLLISIWLVLLTAFEFSKIYSLYIKIRE